MKNAVNPALAAVVIVLIVIVAAVFIYKGANGNTGSVQPMGVGHAGPFAPGGSANNKGGKPAGATGHTIPPPVQ